VKIDRETVVTISFTSPSGARAQVIGLVDEPITLDVANASAASRPLPNVWVIHVTDPDEPAPRRRKPRRS
jgi:hypothetical protein